MTEVRGLSLSPVVLPEVRREAGVELRKARLEDVDAIYWLIRYWAEKGLMLVRSHSHLYENIRDFWVLEDEDGQIVGTVALGNHGITIHRQDCANLSAVPVERRLPVQWNPQASEALRRRYPVQLRIEVNRQQQQDRQHRRHRRTSRRHHRQLLQGRRQR